MRSKLKLGITILAFTLAGCAGDSSNWAGVGGTLVPVPAVVDTSPITTQSGGFVTSARGGVPVTARDWNCPRCYK